MFGSTRNTENEPTKEERKLQPTSRRVGGLESLPEELVLAILSFLNTAEDLCAVSLVCKQFHHIANDDQLWLPLSSPQWNVPPGGWKEAYLCWMKKAIAVYLEKRKASYRLQQAPATRRDYDILVKISLVGGGGVGKTSLLWRFVNDTFTNNPQAISEVDSHKVVRIEGKRVKVIIWDRHPEERSTITMSHYILAHGFLLIFDLTRMESFDNITWWRDEIKSYGSADLPTVLIGNKQDLYEERQVDCQLAEDLASEHGMNYVEVSTKTGANVDNAFIQLLTTIVLGGDFGYEVPGPRPRYIPPTATLQKMGILS
jgi:small GTP-binding protein